MKSFKEFIKESKVKFRINKDLSIDAFQNIDIHDKQLKEIPIQFNTINGDFKCDK
jgi:hypothetical protein